MYEDVKKSAYFQFMGYVSYSVSDCKHHFEPGPYISSSDFQLSIELNPTDGVIRNSCFYHRADNKGH